MMFRYLAATLLAAQTALAYPLEKRDGGKSGINWGHEKIRGVNIGGWLVLEPWITPSIFQNIDQSLGIVDEFTLTQRLPQQAPQILRKHWDTWVGFNDFQKIASAGMNIVRIPIGYWAYDNRGSPYVQGAKEYMDAAIDWARGTNPPLKVIIDLHGAPGSQNGYDNSGQRLASGSFQWLKGGAYTPRMQQTYGVLKQISDKYAHAEYSDVVAGIELINEPFGPGLNRDDLSQFYREGFGRVRQAGQTTVIMSDAFAQPDTWNGFLTPSDNHAQNVAVDHHEYQVFDNSLVALAPWQHRQLVCNNAQSYNGADKWTFVGEWTAAMTDCAPALNGYNVGARYDGTFPDSSPIGSCAGWSNIGTWDQTRKDDVRGYIEAQLEAFEQKTQGWVFWNFKTEAAHEWDWGVLSDNGVFPNPVTDRKFGAICNNL
ncbi:glycoside hydrolase family 5 protein [Aulographum hederae CBS 113979]|uniref:Glycoside hydrolase family 5 protein n=1 Tax=Aulographum hederae CBS 113979 TaxID=1176131 RepID=A0A6G1GX54_9PEZI|nr:glycoside hydrolase family 5 protein [Aulographum hederae CBS 113979]